MYTNGFWEDEVMATSCQSSCIVFRSTNHQKIVFPRNNLRWSSRAITNKSTQRPCGDFSKTSSPTPLLNFLPRKGSHEKIYMNGVGWACVFWKYSQATNLMTSYQLIPHLRLNYLLSEKRNCSIFLKEIFNKKPSEIRVFRTHQTCISWCICRSTLQYDLMWFFLLL